MLHILVLLLVGVADAHRVFGPATNAADTATLAAQWGPLNAEEIENALAGLDRAIQFSGLRLTECGRHLLPEPFRNDSGAYTEFMTEYHGLLVEYRALFARLAAGENVPAEDLNRIRIAAKDCGNRAHKVLLPRVR